MLVDEVDLEHGEELTQNSNVILREGSLIRDLFIPSDPKDRCVYLNWQESAILFQHEADMKNFLSMR